MKNMKLLTLGILCLVLVGCVSALTIFREDTRYSFDNSNEVHEWREAQSPPVKKIITREEYNDVFQDWRDGIISKEEASNKLRSSKW